MPGALGVVLVNGGTSLAAQYRVGLAYATGTGVPLDQQLAFQWFSKAALRGHANAQYNVGVFYFLGRAVAVDYPRAYVWLSLALTHLTQADGPNLALAGEARAAAKSHLTPAQLAEADRQVQVWTPTP